jgi:uncharacterized protein (TIGR02246 family)
MNKRGWLSGLATGVLVWALFAVAQPDAREALMQADRDFDAVTAAKGADGWASFFAEDGRMYRANGEIVRGRAAIRALMAPLFGNPKNSLRWQPDSAEVAQSADLGYTTGTSKARVAGPDGKIAERDGKYVTIWRKQKDGSWKVALDIGVSGPPRTVDPQP